MRQLIAVAEGDTLRYFLSTDGESIAQVAQVLNPGLDVADVLRLGNVLTEALRLNGHQPAVATAATPLPPAPMPKRRRPFRNADHRAPTLEEIFAFIRDHGGCTTGEIAAALVPVPLGNTKPVQTINNRIISYRKRCHDQGVPSLIDSEKGRHSWIGPR